MLTFPLPTLMPPESRPKASQGYALCRERVRGRCWETAGFRWLYELPLMAAQPAGSNHGTGCIENDHTAFLC